MGRIRTIKPEFWRHEGLSALPEFCHMLAAALLNYADDEGYFNANPRLILAECFPLREPSMNIHCAITELSNIGFVKVGLGADGRAYGHITKFTEHQRVNRPYPSKIRVLSIAWTDSLNVHGMISERSSPEKEKEKEKEGERYDGGGEAQAREIEISPTKTDREKILTAIGVDPFSGLTGHGGRMIGTRADMQRVTRWSELGLTIEDQCAVIREVMAKRNGQGPPNGFKFLTSRWNGWLAKNWPRNWNRSTFPKDRQEP